MKEGVETLGRIRAKGIGLLAVTLAIGMLAGVAIERVRASRETADPWPPDSGMMGPLRDGRLPPMFQRLDLTAEQRSRIVAIMKRGRPRTDSVLRHMLPRLRAVTDSIHAEIRAVLTPEQLARWDSMLAEMRTRRGRMRHGQGRRGPGRGAAPPPAPWEIEP